MSTDETPNRFEKARAEALEWVDGLHKDDKMVVLQVAANTQVMQSETSDKEALRRAIKACRVQDAPTRLIPALKMAESLVKNSAADSNPEIHLFSDGAVPDSTLFDNKDLPLVFHRVGKRADNVGITALDVRANPEDSSQRALYASVENFSSNAMDTSLELRFNGDPRGAAPPDFNQTRRDSPQVFFGHPNERRCFYPAFNLERRPGGGQRGVDCEPPAASGERAAGDAAKSAVGKSVARDPQRATEHRRDLAGRATVPPTTSWSSTHVTCLRPGRPETSWRSMSCVTNWFECGRLRRRTGHRGHPAGCTRSCAMSASIMSTWRATWW